MNDNIQISLYDVVTFLMNRWKLYLAGFVLGAIFATSFAFFNSSYTASIILNISPNFETSSNFKASGSGREVPFDLIAWRATQKKLVEMMQELASSDSSQGKKPAYIAVLASTEWWHNHVTPIKVLTTDEAKELLGINSMIIGNNKPSEDTPLLKSLGRVIAEATRISALQLSQTAKTADVAISQVEETADVIVNSLALLRYHAFTETLRTNALDLEAKANTELGALILNLNALERQRNSLIRLNQEYPNWSPQWVGVLDKDMSKYLPIPTQLIAINLDIDDVKEQIYSVKLEQEQNEINRELANAATSILNKEYSNKVVGQQILGVEKTLRMGIRPEDVHRIIALDRILTHLLNIISINDSQIKETSAFISKAPTTLNAGIKGAGLGLALALLLSIFIFLFQKSHPNSQSSSD
jgi:hypothetical protein